MRERGAKILSTLKTLDIKKNLQKKGFVMDTDGSHIFFYYYYNGCKTGISTHISHGDKEIGDPLIKEMKNETRLSKEEFIDLVQCPLTKDMYLNILMKKGYIPSNRA